MALTEQQIRQITDEIVRSLSGSIRAEAAAPAPEVNIDNAAPSDFNAD